MNQSKECCNLDEGRKRSLRALRSKIDSCHRVSTIKEISTESRKIIMTIEEALAKEEKRYLTEKA